MKSLQVQQYNALAHDLSVKLGHAFVAIVPACPGWIHCETNKIMQKCDIYSGSPHDDGASS